MDPFVRKGYRFKGPAVVHERGTDGFATGIRRMREEGLATAEERIKTIVVIEVQRGEPLVSPAYDDGTRDEADITRSWQERFARLHPRQGDNAPRL